MPVERGVSGLKRSTLRRLEFYALAIFGGVIGQWSIGLLRHLWYVVARHVALR